jgi:diguanylate cyclase (GGDEF)-like protein
MEIALDITDIREQVDKLNSYVHNELIVNEALKIVLAWNDPLTSMEKLLEYVGKNYDCDRAYIFEETRKDIIDNTHEWCRQGVSAEKDNLQNIPKEDAKIWMDRFINNENIIVTNLDDVKLHDRVMYDYLYPQNITTLVVAPLVYENQIIGFFGVDNPPIYLMHNISKTFDILAGFIVSLLRRQQIYRELKELSYHDQLTGFDNRISYDKYVEELSNYSSVGIIFMDIVGLKITNDTYGHKAGDALIIKTCDIIKTTFENYKCFRLGGDEFVAICTNIDKDVFNDLVNTLRVNLAESDINLSIGVSYAAGSTVNMKKMLAEADKQMYEDKNKYYSDNNLNRRKEYE